MPQVSPAIDALPAAAAAALRQLGSDLGTARKRRKQSLREWALRMSISVPTLMRMEKGDATVSAGVYVTAIWMISRQEALSELAAPQYDLAALESDVSEARDRYRRQDPVRG